MGNWLRVAGFDTQEPKPGDRYVVSALQSKDGEITVVYLQKVKESQ